MRKKFLRRASKAARWSPRLAMLALFLLFTTILCQYFVDMNIKLLAGAIGLCGFVAACGFAASIRGFVDLWTHGDKGGHASVKGILFSLITLIPTSSLLILWLTLPPLYDVATDLENPPPFLAAVRPVTALPIHVTLVAQTEEQRTAWSQLSGRRYDGAPDRILNAVESVLVERGWELVTQKGRPSEDAEILVAARANFGFIRLVHDISIRLRDEDDTTFVDMRAAARDLARDFGLGSHYITGFMNELDKAVLLTPIEVEE